MGRLVQNVRRSHGTHGWYGEILFDIPVYRLAKDEYESQQESYVQKNLKSGGPYAEAMYLRDPVGKQRMEHHLRLVYGGTWLFNEIIGYIRLYFFGTQIRGEYWRTNAKKIGRSRKRTIIWRTWKVVDEEEIPRNSSNREILDLIRKYLNRAQIEISPRYIDLAVFNHLAPHVSWKTLFKKALRRT